jgi:hypothetical protein
MTELFLCSCGKRVGLRRKKCPRCGADLGTFGALTLPLAFYLLSATLMFSTVYPGLGVSARLCLYAVSGALFYIGLARSRKNQELSKPASEKR